MASTDLAVIEPGGYLMLNHEPAEVMQIIRDNLGDDELTEFDLPRVKIPAGGGKTWEIPALGGTDSAQTLEGVLIHFKTTRAYWPDKNPTGKPPQCKSDNAVIGIGNPGGRCRECPLSQFGPDGEAPDCKKKEIWFLLRHDMWLPLVLALPPTSTDAAKDYRIEKVSAFGMSYYSVVTQITLMPDTNAAGQKFSRAVPEIGGLLSKEEAARARAIAEQFRPLFDATVAAATVEDEMGPNANGGEATPAEEDMVARARETFGDEPGF